MLWSLPTLFLCDWFVPREHLQKSITFRTSDDGDSNLVHLLKLFSFFLSCGALRKTTDRLLRSAVRNVFVWLVSRRCCGAVCPGWGSHERVVHERQHRAAVHQLTRLVSPLSAFHFCFSCCERGRSIVSEYKWTKCIHFFYNGLRLGLINYYPKVIILPSSRCFNIDNGFYLQTDIKDKRMNLSFTTYLIYSCIVM